MRKPNIISKSKLRENLAKTIAFVQDKNKEVWITDNNTIGTVLVDANKYDNLQKENARLKNEIFDLETQQSIEEFKRGEYKTFNSVDEFFKDLDDPTTD